MASNYFQVSLDKIPEAKRDDVIELCINPDGSLWGEFQGDHFMRRLDTVLTKTDIKDLASQIADKASTPMSKNKPIISVSVPYHGRSIRAQVIQPPAVRDGYAIALRFFSTLPLADIELKFLFGAERSLEAERQKKNLALRNVVASVAINYSVDKTTNTVTVSHSYQNSQGEAVETIAGMQPLHWKNSAQTTSAYQIKSARGTIKFSETTQFSYQLPFVGILPTLPSIDGTFDQITLETMITEFIAQGDNSWNTHTDAYWSGKNYSKVAELIAIAESIGMTTEAATLRNWLKIELSDWFTAETDNSLDINKYFVYDEEWSTLLALEESFMSHQQLNDHHFHYGYLIRAAAEICRMDASWCGDEQYGPMIELLIRDYAGGRDDSMFPYLRNFDPANGFSWASGKVNFARGNNNESTSEAANAYGAIILYGLITANDDLVERGMYLHASTTAAYWEYWNNIDDYNAVGETENNFPDGYDKITTSIIWGDGAVFSTWFSAAYAHILGIQGLPINPLTLHVGLHADYMEDYVTLGLSESSNNKPSGLVDDQWRDIWWNLWAMTNADLAINDYESVSSYDAEAGETKAHTYHWLHTFSKLGHLKTGTGTLTANHPAALAFEKNGVTSYVVYNFSNQTLQATFSDGKVVAATANGFTVVSD